MKATFLLLITVTLTSHAQNSYSVRKLVSDLPGVAEQTDPQLRNPWGIAASSTSPLWVSDNRTGLATVYNSDGKGFPDAAPLVVSIPGAAGAVAAPTAQVFNDTGAFEIQPGKPAVFLIATEDGTIAGWNSSVDPARAVTVIDNSGAGAVYKGLAVVRTDAGPRLYAANFRTGTVDVFDGDFHPVATSDELRGPVIPGYAPFNIQRLGQKLYVTYARQDGEGRDDVAGAGNGFIYCFTLDGQLVSRLIEGGSLNSPWGLAIAPEYFGAFGGALLAGNFGDGTINAYDPCSGNWLGAIADSDGATIVLPGLWGLRTGNGHNGGESGVLYFTAGIPGDDDLESHGLVGTIRPVAPAAPAAVSKFAIDIENLRFTPSATEVGVGGVITWTNRDGFAHTVKGDTEPFASGVLNQNGAFSKTFDTPGTYSYHCTIHPFMKGEVTVR
jgi:uncharacterized protein (TIGR03118 family)